MSAPPPGGPPPPQQPPTYPQYPPQYPPQQPYYPAPAPPPKESHLALIIVLVVVVVVLVLVVLGWWIFTSLTAPMTQTGITVTAVSFSINYPGSTHWFGPSPITTCANCPIKTNLLSQFSYTLNLHNTDTVAHNITDVSLAGFSFTIVAVSPKTPSTASPIVVSAGATQSIILTIQPTTITGGSYTLTGTIDTD